MQGLLLDTHALIWLAEKDAKLGKKAVSHITRHYSNQSLFVSAISFWEIGMLAAKGRLKLTRSPASWRSDVLQAGIQEIPLSGDIGLLATQLDWPHADPADRMIVASALQGKHSLMTADRAILTWKHNLKRIDASL